MRNADVKEVKKETIRFFDKLKELINSDEFQESERFDGSGEVLRSKETASVRRASMDLTRLLSKLRRPR